MAFVLWLGLALVPFLLGKGALAIIYGKQYREENYWSDIYLTGLIICIGLTEAVHLTAVFFGWSFSDIVRLWNVLTASLSLVVLIGVLGKQQKRKKDPALRKAREREQLKRKMTQGSMHSASIQFLYLAFGLSVLLQAILLLTGQVQDQAGDMTLESVQSFLAADSIYQVNPLTGLAYKQGIPLRLKILSLPTLYGIISKTFQVSAEGIVTRIVPVVVLLAGYFVYGRLASILFAKDRTKKGIFLLIVTLLIWLGGYAPVMDGFGIMNCGYLGTTIRNWVLAPYTICLFLKGRYRMILLCILAEACIVWTLYGMGVCLAVTVIMAIVTFILRRTRFLREDAVWNG